MRKTMMSLTVAIAAFGTVAALAQSDPAAPPPPMRGGGAMMRADRDGDGVITRAEMIAEATERFDRMDTNHDGKLDQAELGAIAAMRHQQRRGLRDGAASPPPPPAPPPGE